MVGNRGILWAIAGILTVLLFLGGPGYQSPRSVCAAWDLGHILVFSIWSYLLLAWGPVGKTSVARQWAVVLAFCFIAGGMTEMIQLRLGGDASFGDILRDGVGGVIALAWFAPTMEMLSKRMRSALRILSITFLLVACLPLAVSSIDEGIALAQFPLLSDFETPFEKDRWEGEARISVDRSIARHGKASLRVEMDTSFYSGIFLVHFPGNWKAYRFLRLDVFNPSPEGVDITCRIHDRRHDQGEQRYENRFNKVFRLLPGWNDLRIDLGEAAKTPGGRAMDLGEIRGLGLFATKLSAPRTIFVDYVRLE